jgi:hypothetical protein
MLRESSVDADRPKEREAGGEEREAGTSAAANLPVLLRGNTQQSRAHQKLSNNRKPPLFSTG